MLVNEGTYLINSLGEKYIYSDRFIFKWLSAGGFKTLIGRVAELNKKHDEELEEEEEATENGDDPCG